jgi:hypothetical protein
LSALYLPEHGIREGDFAAEAEQGNLDQAIGLADWKAAKE